MDIGMGNDGTESGGGGRGGACSAVGEPETVGIAARFSGAYMDKVMVWKFRAKMK